MASSLRLPGRVYELLIPKAIKHSRNGDPDQDIAEAVSMARIRPRGGGLAAWIPLELEQVLRLAEWITDEDPAVLRRYRDAMREQAQAALAGGDRS